MAEKKSETIDTKKTVSMKEIREHFTRIDVNDFIDEKKTGRTNKDGTEEILKYLQWARMMKEVMEFDPDARFEIVEFDDNGLRVKEGESGRSYQRTFGGFFVWTRVTIKGQTREFFLPVMDPANRPMKDHPYQVANKWGRVFTIMPMDSMALNTSIMRCFVKNIAINFGLGWKVYAGDVEEPEDETVVDGNNQMVNPTTGEVISTPIMPAPVAPTPVENVAANPAPATAAMAQPDFVTVEAPALPELGDAMSLQEAQLHTLSGGGDKYKGHTVQYMIDTAKSAEHARMCLESFASKGSPADRKACAIVLEAFDNGIIQYAPQEAAAA